MLKVIRSFIVACTVVLGSQLQAASAVAVGISPTGKPYWSCWHDPKLSEASVRSRAIEMGRVGHARNQRIIASTSKLGFGAVVEFLKTDKTLDYAVALGAPTWDAAVNEAKKKAKSLGGRAFRVWRGWNDGLRTNQPIIMQKL
jgi:hypothetical protein